MTKILSVFAILFATASFAEEVNFDGCAAVKVEGANYYNLVDPNCKTASEEFSSSKGEDKRAELIED